MRVPCLLLLLQEMLHQPAHLKWKTDHELANQQRRNDEGGLERLADGRDGWVERRVRQGDQ